MRAIIENIHTLLEKRVWNENVTYQWASAIARVAIQEPMVINVY